MKVTEYRARLQSVVDWEPFLLAESGLPGPRANLELVEAVATEGETSQFLRWALLTPEQAPAGSAQEFLPVCGVVGLGESVARGDTGLLPLLRQHAADPRWRVREGVAMALQRVGDRDLGLLLREAQTWAGGGPLEQRAAAAALCEPRLLRDARHAEAVLDVLDRITQALSQAVERRSEELRVLRQGLGYCWSVAVVACPGKGKALLEKWAARDDRDVRWIVRENLKKKRLARMDAGWVAEMCQRVG